MAKVKTYQLSNGDRQRIIEDFFLFVLHLKSERSGIIILLELMTPSEALMFARRLQVAKKLLQKNNSYENIRSRLKVSFQTITKMDRWLHTNDADRDSWLAQEIGKLTPVVRKKQTAASSGRSGLNRYPEHRMMQQFLRRFFT